MNAIEKDKEYWCIIVLLAFGAIDSLYNLIAVGLTILKITGIMDVEWSDILYWLYIMPLIAFTLIMLFTSFSLLKIFCLMIFDKVKRRTSIS